MALENSNYGEGERWEAQNEELPEGKHLGTLFEFKCWEARDEKDYVSFGFQVDGLKVQRFYCLTTKSGKSLGWKLEKDMRTLLGAAPPASDLQVDGRTGPVKHKLIGLKVNLSNEERDGYTDLYLDGVVLADDSAVDGW